jgi:large conductance mechanosensitive channel
MSLLREFRDFAVKGNVVDLAVGIIIGAAFGKIVASLVEDIVMPGIGALGGVDFKGLAVQVGEAKILYGKFIQTCVDFLIIAASIFVAVKVINYLRREDQEKPPAAPPPRQEKLLEEIRDLLKQATKKQESADEMKKKTKPS